MRRGLILAGGRGTRLFPITKSVNKQLLPVYDKPLIYYPLSTLMKAGIQDIMVITMPGTSEQLFQGLLGDGSQFGTNISYATQDKPRGIADAFLIAKSFIKWEDVTLALGDNIFYGQRFNSQMKTMSLNNDFGCRNMIFGCHVNNPKAYGVACLDEAGNLISIEEKPDKPKSNYAIPGLYFYDDTVIDRASNLQPSKRGELEITDLNNSYIKDNKMNFMALPPGTAWFDTGTHEDLLEAGEFIRAVQKRTGLRVADLESIAIDNKWL